MMSDVLGAGWGPFAGQPRTELDNLVNLPVGEFARRVKSSKKKPLRKWEVTVEKLTGIVEQAKKIVFANTYDAAETLARQYAYGSEPEFVSTGITKTSKTYRFQELKS
jgi:hypothetical protein